MLNPTNLKITVASHVLGMHACKSRNQWGGGGYSMYISRGSGGMFQRFLCHKRAI